MPLVLTPTAGREVVLFRPPLPLETLPGGALGLSESPLRKIIADISSRALSPRAMQALSLDLYAGGVLSWEEHEDLSFQVDLHPDFALTIGALTGDTALPDRPRDHIKVWEKRLDFETRHAPLSHKRTRALRILSILRRIVPQKA